jgi:hypothetical protein
MRLANFIQTHIEPILAAWESFARATSAGAAMEPLALRDHAEQILLASAQALDSQPGGLPFGQACSDQLLRAASEAHALERVDSGFNLLEMVSEYSALRASVVQLWRDSAPQPDSSDIADLMHFDQCVDQSLATAIAAYTARVDRSHRMFLAILGHDLRNPLNCVLMAAQALELSERLDPGPLALAAQVSSSAAVMARMIADLLDFTGAGLGAAMPICPQTTDLASICRDVCAECRAANPTRTIRFESSGDLVGTWDPARLRQVLSNLLGNAVQHGAGTGPGIGSVDLAVHAQDEGVVLSVRNSGAPIPPEALPTIFDPLTRASPERKEQRRPGSIGLGLYIAREIVTAHEGAITVRSSAAEGTLFIVRLPRHVAGSASAAQASAHPSAGLAPALESGSPAIFVKAK